MASSRPVLITGSSGLIGSEAAVFADQLGHEVVGVDAHMRGTFFGAQGDTRRNHQCMLRQCARYRHTELDVRCRDGIDRLIQDVKPGVVIHAAAQPSHELAAKQPFEDFDINATGTLNLLEACRRHAPDVIFVHVSTNKVYGDRPNQIKFKELATRWEYDDPAYKDGVSEDLPIDRCLHSPFGASKLAADVMVQEYGRYYGLQTGVFRAGCVTGPRHAGVELHGFLHYLVEAAVTQQPYCVFGYKGKQVRDQIHSYDLIRAFWHFVQAPSAPGTVYNVGGGKANAASLLECVEMIEQACGKRPQMSYRSQPRKGDHICYYSNRRKFLSCYPQWQLTRSLEQILEELIEQAEDRMRRHAEHRPSTGVAAKEGQQS